MLFGLFQQVPITAGYLEAEWEWDIWPTLLHMTGGGDRAHDPWVFRVQDSNKQDI